MKKLLLIFCVALMPFNIFAAENLIKNGGFSNDLEDWTTYSYEDNSAIYAENGAVVLASEEDNHVSIYQSVKVAPGENYKFSAEIETENVSGGSVGAALGFYYKTSYSEGVFETDSAASEFYFTTKSDEVPLMLTLGGYSELSRGKAVFKNIAVEKVDNVPQNAKYFEYIGENKKEDTKSTNFDVRWVILTVLLIAATAFGVYTVCSEKS